MHRTDGNVTDRIERIVLDVHGVLLNNPFMAFLGELAEATGQTPELVRRRWRTELHDLAWLDRIDDGALWDALAGGPTDHRRWARELELSYAPGPAAHAVERWSARVPVDILSNHRARWLDARLARFGLLRHVDRVHVSGALGVMKPDPGAFAAALDGAGARERVLMVDDQERNVRAARALGMRAIHARPDDDWIARIDRSLDAGSLQSYCDVTLGT